MDDYESKSLVLALFNLEDDDVKSLRVDKVGEIVEIDILLAEKTRPPCPVCGCNHAMVKEYVIKRIQHSVLSDRQCILKYRARRYKCNLCGHTYYEHNPFCFTGQKISILTVENVLRDLKSQNETFASVADRYHISPTSVASIFDQHVDLQRLPLPEYMCWDECYAFHHPGYHSKYVCTFLDFKTASPIDILPSRQKDYLVRYCLTIPKEERDKVKMISSDMYKTYRQVIHEMFPKAIQSVDHYHMSQEMGRKLDSVRIRVMKTFNKESNEYYLLKKFNWLLFKRPDATLKDTEENKPNGVESEEEKERKKRPLFSPYNETKFNKKLNRHLNYYDIKLLIKDIDPTLAEVWELKDKLYYFYRDSTEETAEKELNKLINEFRASGIPEVKEYAKTLKLWSVEILNSFKIINTEYSVNKDTGQVELSERKLNNGLMENRNSILKIIKKNANGYTNWERFRNRCLYVLRKDAVPLLYPIKKRKGGVKV